MRSADGLWVPHILLEILKNYIVTSPNTRSEKLHLSKPSFAHLKNMRFADQDISVSVFDTFAVNADGPLVNHAVSI